MRLSVVLMILSVALKSILHPGDPIRHSDISIRRSEIYPSF
ncbi:hypothetical protein [Lysinibacillus sp. fls2-241-R2A-57]|nr:hypothetical protein [Lysinibacillus sp. fls2-241-R2A-57]